MDKKHGVILTEIFVIHEKIYVVLTTYMNI